MVRIAKLFIFCLLTVFFTAVNAKTLSVQIINGLLGQFQLLTDPSDYSPSNAIYYCPPPQSVGNGPNSFITFVFGDCPGKPKITDISSPQVTYTLVDGNQNPILQCTLVYFLNADQTCGTQLTKKGSTNQFDCKVTQTKLTDPSVCNFSLEFYPRGIGKERR